MNIRNDEGVDLYISIEIYAGMGSCAVLLRINLHNLQLCYGAGLQIYITGDNHGQAIRKNK